MDQVNRQDLAGLAESLGALLLILTCQAIAILSIHLVATITGDAALAAFITLVAAGKGALPAMAIFLAATISVRLLWILRPAIKHQASWIRRKPGDQP